MSNSSSEVSDDVSQRGLDSMVYLNVNDITASSDYGSSGTPSNRQSLTPVESTFEEFQQNPRHSVIIDRKILLAKDFYPIAQNTKETKNLRNSLESINKSSKWSSLKSSAKQILPCCSNSNSKTCSPFSVLFNLFPILKWLNNYSIRDNLMYDVIAGVTILALHIPQGLAYGRLAGGQPIHGLYVSLFPVVVYAIFGGSRQISIGTFAVISIACRDVVEQIIGSELLDGNQNIKNETVSINSTFISNFIYQTAEQLPIEEKITSIEVLTSLCLLVGIIQFTIGLLRLGVLATLLSDPIISAFCVAAAVHVFTSQVFSLIGVDSTVGSDELDVPFDIIKNWHRLINRLHTANLTTVCISFSTILVLIGCKNYLEPYLMKRFKLKSIAIPIDIISIVALTLISYVFDLHGHQHVQLIPQITAGFDGLPVVPRIDLWPRLFTSAILIAFICYAGTYSLQKLYARKNGYEVYPNQELFAMGIANAVSSFFLCYPCAGSLARSAVQDKVGGKTQMASLISSGLIVIFIMFLSRFLETLPKCALACIIIVALISTFKKFTEVFHYWKISKLDGIVWIATFLLVILLGVDRGLLFGLGVGLGMMILRLAMPELNLKYHLPNTECYLSNTSTQSLSTHQLSHQGVIIFEFHGPLIFINVERFKKKFQQLVLEKIRKQIQDHTQTQISKNLSLSATSANSDPVKLQSTINLAASGLNIFETNNDSSNTFEPAVHTVIFDMSQVSYLDGKAVECLLEINSELSLLKSTSGSVCLFLSNVSSPVFDTLLLCQFFTKFDHKKVFLTVHDAVLVANDFLSSQPESNIVTKF